MNCIAYKALLTSLCDAIGFSDREHFLQTGLLTIEGVNVFLRYDESSEPAMLEIRIDCGPVPDECREKVWHTLLVCNFAADPLSHRTFGILPDNDHVVLTLLYPLSLDLMGRDLAEVLITAITDTQINLEEIARNHPPSLDFLLGRKEI